ncbi:hypothetical protein CR513_35017, partial [Mucuna pruriens]
MTPTSNRFKLDDFSSSSHSAALRIKITGTWEVEDFASPNSRLPIDNSEAEFCCSCVLDTFPTGAQMLALSFVDAKDLSTTSLVSNPPGRGKVALRDNLIHDNTCVDTSDFNFTAHNKINLTNKVALQNDSHKEKDEEDSVHKAPTKWGLGRVDVCQSPQAESVSRGRPLYSKAKAPQQELTMIFTHLLPRELLASGIKPRPFNFQEKHFDSNR